MAKFSRTNITIETTDGRFIRERVVFADQMQYEKTARARGWTPERDQAVSNLFMAYTAMKRTGQHGLSWEEFTDWVFDVQVDSEDVDTETGEAWGNEPGDPTL